MTGRGRIPYFQLQKVWRLHILCHNNEVNTSLYRRYEPPLTSMGQTQLGVISTSSQPSYIYLGTKYMKV
ncbi:hypothetical protein HanIR_Chr06g0277221 [Helianthus annuus]|nr:hypothetical protein HanIR_Chr06g0277221 [Helianthus annuus]